MISEGPTLIEALPGGLQGALDGALEPGEELVIAVRGNMREAFAATRDRLLVLKEPMISGTAPIEVGQAPLASISNVRAEPRPVGGRLMWDCAEPGAPGFIEYPTYDASKYALVAKRLQEMIGQPRNPKTQGAVPEAPPVIPAAAAAAARTCPKCRTGLPAEGCWCPSCGLQVSDPCWECGWPLGEGANFCTRCGTPNTEPAVVQCPGCKAVVNRGQGYCPACGTQARTICAECDSPMRQDWARCPRCGGEPAWGEEGEGPEPAPRAAPAPVVGAAVEARPTGGRAEAANSAAVQAYEAGNYSEAARLFRQAVEVEPENAGYWVNLGVAYGELGDDLQAFTAYRRAVELNPDEIQAYLNMGYLYLERERNAEAREMWEMVIRVAPDSDEAEEARQNLKNVEDV